MKNAQLLELLSVRATRSLKGSFDSVAFRSANRYCAQDDKP